MHPRKVFNDASAFCNGKHFSTEDVEVGDTQKRLARKVVVKRTFDLETRLAFVIECQEF